MPRCARPVLALLLFLPLTLLAESDPLDVPKLILQQDAQFWDAYNRCDVAAMPKFIAHNVEFYHDKGGTTLGMNELVDSIRKNLCSNPDFHLRREAVPDSVHVFPLRKDNVVYGAVLSGDHYFYVNEKGKPEFRDGLAKFFHVWLQEDGVWKMARIVSYDHKAAP